MPYNSLVIAWPEITRLAAQTPRADAGDAIVMLTKLSLTNFKSWERIEEMRLAPITGLFGRNSSGKTSILQMLLMLKQTAASPDRSQVLDFGDRGGSVDLGTFRDVVHKGVVPRQLGWKLDWGVPEGFLAEEWRDEGITIFEGDHVGFEAVVTDTVNRFIGVKRFAYSFGGHVFGMERRAGTLGDYQLFTTPETFQFRCVPERSEVLPRPIKCYGFPSQVKAVYENAGFLADFEVAFEELFERVYYLGPLREYPEREYTWAGGEPADVGKRGENAIAALLAARQQGVLISRGRGRPRRALEEYVAWWLRELGLIHDFAVEPVTAGSNLYQAWVTQAPGSPRVLLTEVGFGVSQVLPVLVLCYYVPEGSIILLEQPEMHLHPRAQTELADVLMDAVKTRHVQIIVESHSEHLLRRLQRRIAEERYDAADAALYFCDIEEGASRLTPLELNEFGNITNWPPEFFGDDFGEIAAMTEAAMQRKLRLSA